MCAIPHHFVALVLLDPVALAISWRICEYWQTCAKVPCRHAKMAFIDFRAFRNSLANRPRKWPLVSLVWDKRDKERLNDSPVEVAGWAGWDQWIATVRSGRCWVRGCSAAETRGTAPPAAPALCDCSPTHWKWTVRHLKESRTSSIWGVSFRLSLLCCGQRKFIQKSPRCPWSKSWGHINPSFEQLLLRFLSPQC